jgi:hypothetical protein
VHSVEVINGSVFVPLTLLFAWGTVQISHLKINKIPFLSILLTVIIVSYGLTSFMKNDFTTHSMHTGAPSLLVNSKMVVDYSYQNAKGSEFGICSISEPLFMNTVWSFLYSTYGKQKYGYVPYWTGQKQTLNESFIPYAKKKFATKFIIQEPMFGIPLWVLRSVYFIEDSQNSLVAKKKFGSYEVQERYFTKVDGGNINNYSESLKKSIYEDLEKIPQLSCDNIYE